MKPREKSIERMFNHSSLLEIDRKNLVGKTKAQSTNRYNKRLSYHATSYDNVDMSELLTKDLIVAHVTVGDYICTIAFQGVIYNLVEILDKQPNPNITLQSVIRAVTKAIDDTDIYVDCTCPDFIYRFSYYASKYGYKYGRQETRPPRETNPNDNMGSMCKHLTALLSNKRWLVKLSSVINAYIKEHIDEVRDALELSPEELIVNIPNKYSRRNRNNDSDADELSPEIANANNIVNKTDNDSDEELELDDSDNENEEGE